MLEILFWTFLTRDEALEILKAYVQGHGGTACPDEW